MLFVQILTMITYVINDQNWSLMTMISFEALLQALDGAGAKPHFKYAIALLGKGGYWLNWSHVAHEFDQQRPRVSHWFHKPQLPGNVRAFRDWNDQIDLFAKAKDFVGLYLYIISFLDSCFPDSIMFIKVANF